MCVGRFLLGFAFGNKSAGGSGTGRATLVVKTTHHEVVEILGILRKLSCMQFYWLGHLASKKCAWGSAYRVSLLQRELGLGLFASADQWAVLAMYKKF